MSNRLFSNYSNWPFQMKVKINHEISSALLAKQSQHFFPSIQTPLFVLLVFNIQLQSKRIVLAVGGILFFFFNQTSNFPLNVNVPPDRGGTFLMKAWLKRNVEFWTIFKRDWMKLTWSSFIVKRWPFHRDDIQFYLYCVNVRCKSQNEIMRVQSFTHWWERVLCENECEYSPYEGENETFLPCMKRKNVFWMTVIFWMTYLKSIIKTNVKLCTILMDFVVCMYLSTNYRYLGWCALILIVSSFGRTLVPQLIRKSNLNKRLNSLITTKWRPFSQFKKGPFYI